MWDLAKSLKVAKKCKSRGELKNKYPSAYKFLLGNHRSSLDSVLPRYKVKGFEKDMIRVDSYTHSATKQKHREFLRNLLIEKSIGRKDVLTFAGINLLDAKMYGSQKCSIFSVENDHKIYDQQLSEVQQYPFINTFKTDAFSFFKNPLFIP